MREPGIDGRRRAADWALPAVCVVALLVSWSQVRAGGEPFLDRRARKWVWQHQSDTVFTILDAVKDVGSATYAAPVLLLAAGVLSLRRHNPRAILTAGLAIVLLAGTTALLKAVVARPGPSGVGPPVVDGAWPSGHATTIVVVVLVLVALFGRRPERRAWVVGLAVLVPTAVGVGLVYCGHHWLSDVLVGVPLGYLIVRLALTLAEVTLSSSRPAAPDPVVSGLVRRVGANPSARAAATVSTIPADGAGGLAGPTRRGPEQS